KFPIERKPQMSPVPGGELFLLLLQSPLQYLPLDLFKRPSLAEMFNGFCERGGKANDCCVINTPLLEQEGWPKAGVVVRRVVRSIYHPVAARHPSCSRRGAAYPSPPI